MTVAPITGTDVNSYIADTAGNKASTDIVQIVNADGTPFTGGGSQSAPGIVGGEYASTPPTLTNGQTDALQLDVSGNLRSAVVVQSATGADGKANSEGFFVSSTTNSTPRALATFGSVFNGTTWDRMRGDTTGVYMVLKGAGTLATNQATATTTAAQIIAARSGRSRVTITNLGTTDVFIGPSGITISTGQILVGTKGASITLNTSAAIFAIVSTGTQAVSFVEEY